MNTGCVWTMSPSSLFALTFSTPPHNDQFLCIDKGGKSKQPPPAKTPPEKSKPQKTKSRKPGKPIRRGDDKGSQEDEEPDTKG